MSHLKLMDTLDTHRLVAAILVSVHSFSGTLFVRWSASFHARLQRLPLYPSIGFLACLLPPAFRLDICVRKLLPTPPPARWVPRTSHSCSEFALVPRVPCSQLRVHD